MILKDENNYCTISTPPSVFAKHECSWTKVCVFCGHICNITKADHVVFGWIFWMNQCAVSCINLKYADHVKSTQTNWSKTSAQHVSGWDRCAFIMSGMMQSCSVPSPINQVRCLLLTQWGKSIFFFFSSFLPGDYKGQTEDNRMVRTRPHSIQHWQRKGLWHTFIHRYTHKHTLTHTHTRTEITWTWLSLLAWGSSTAAVQAFEHLASLQDFDKHM